jgi:hypothetical protein
VKLTSVVKKSKKKLNITTDIRKTTVLKFHTFQQNFVIRKKDNLLDCGERTTLAGFFPSNAFTSLKHS